MNDWPEYIGHPNACRGQFRPGAEDAEWMAEGPACVVLLPGADCCRRLRGKRSEVGVFTPQFSAVEETS
jgi:hypothetical protein